MYTFDTEIRVRYAETDQMGYVYHGNYAAYFEVARTEAFRQLGISYKDMEADGIGNVVDSPIGKPDLTIRFKHMTHAFLVFSFQEGTAQAFANDRMVADGNVSHSIRLVRCLNRMETLILPKLVAARAVKRYDDVPLAEKLSKAIRIYGLVAKSLIAGN